VSAPPEPCVFFGERLPAQLNRAFADQEHAVESAQRVLEGMRAVRATIRVVVRGEGGGTFHVNLEAGRSTASPGPACPPFLTLVLDRAHYAPLHAEAGGDVLGFLAGISGIRTPLRLTRARVALLEALRGSLLLELTGEAGFQLLAHFGPDPVPERASAAIRVDAETYRALREGRLEPQDAFLGGRIQVEGDLQLASGLALAMLAPD
jgi:hypothetical protein